MIVLFIYILCFSTIFSQQFSVEVIAEGFVKPIYVTTEPTNDSTLYVVEQRGVIKRIKENLIDKDFFLDIRKNVHTPLFPADEMGFLGFEFHPNYETNKYIYVHYNDTRDNTIISQFTVEDQNVNISTEKIILKILQPYSNHNGGTIDFGPDGYLYIALGDGGSSGDPENRAQDLSNLFGTILRIDVNTIDDYLIPKSNPFYNSKDIKNEIWAYGLRNPWRFTFDRLTGDIYIGDVGQNNWEEINWLPSGIGGGINFGWNIMEGLHCYNNLECYDSFDKFVLPIFEYPNDAKYAKTIMGIKQLDMHGCSITGGYVYRGSNIPNIYGRYFFGDYCTGKIWSFINYQGEIVDLQDHTSDILKQIGKKEFYLSSFGEDSSGEIYLVDYNGSIYKFIRN